ARARSATPAGWWYGCASRPVSPTFTRRATPRACARAARGSSGTGPCPRASPAAGSVSSVRPGAGPSIAHVHPVAVLDRGLVSGLDRDLPAEDRVRVGLPQVLRDLVHLGEG